MRKLVTVRTIDNIQLIDGADRIEVVSVDGWNVVAKKGEFVIGDKCVYFEIDSYLPVADVRFAFLDNGRSKEVEGEQRVRLRTMRMRGQISQGLVLPLHLFPEIVAVMSDDGVDLASVVNVIKYERPESTSGTDAAGGWPHWLRKTDEERIQNCYNSMKRDYGETRFIPTLKLDGTSCTIVFLNNHEISKRYWKHENGIGNLVNGYVDVMITGELDDDGETITKTGEFQLFSRNLQIKWDVENLANHYTVAAHSVINQLRALSEHLGVSLALQGEVMGTGIQKNQENIQGHKFFAFNLFDIDNQKYYSWEQAKVLLDEYSIPTVPSLGESERVFDKTLDEILEHANGESLYAKQREGVVWKSVGLDNPVSFKAISNEWLLKNE